MRGVAREEPPDQPLTAAGEPGVILQGGQDEPLGLAPERLVLPRHEPHVRLRGRSVGFVARHAEEGEFLFPVRLGRMREKGPSLTSTVRDGREPQGHARKRLM